MSNGRPGVSQSYGGTGFAANEAEIYQMGGLQGQFGMPMMGADGLVDMGEDYRQPDVTRTFITPEHLAGDRRTSETVIPGEPTNMFTIEQAELEYFRLDEQQRQRFEDAVTKTFGYTPAPVVMQSQWNNAVKFVAGYQKATGEGLSPFAYQEGLAARAEGSGRGGGAYTGPVTTVQKSKDINLTNPTQARAFLDSALGEYLGRLPNEEEYENFRKALNAQERMSPVITESESTVTPQGQARREVEAESTRRGGVTPGQFATEFARSQEGAAETAVAGPLLNAFMGLLRGGTS